MICRSLLRPVLTIALTSAWLIHASSAADPSTPSLPASWQETWDNPPPECRPLQIVHNVDLHGRLVEGVEQILGGSESEKQVQSGMEYYRGRGLGGLVCNVAFQDYMTSEENWQNLIAAVKACHERGMIVWIYDEKGYPSGGAGGLVLKEDTAHEALELAFDAECDEPFIVRPAYEYTHASNNYHAARRYINLLDNRAVDCFVAITHQQYWRRLEPYFGNTIQATFTDEPSLIAINIGQIPEDARKRVRVDDPIDPNFKLLPRVPWCRDLPDRYRERYGEDLLANRRSLFTGDTPKDRRVRRQFWSLIADLVADRYFGTLERWCEQHRVASSGHSLSEEALLKHVPLEGNGLKVLGRMHIPGLDLLSSNPESVIHGAWMTAAMPASAARLGGKRRVMTEVSDFSQKMSGQGPVDLAAMQATAAWQAAWDVTEFTLYYGTGDRSVDDYRAYCQFVGRLNAILKRATPAPDVLLYYPIYDLWSEYVPTAERLTMDSQTPRARQLVNSFRRLGQSLTQRQMPFTLIDHDNLQRAEVRDNGLLSIGGRDYRSIVLPYGVELPESAAAVVARFVESGGKVLRDGLDASTNSPESLCTALQPTVRIEPASSRIVLGRFTRDGREVLALVNVGTEPYEGKLLVSNPGPWLALDPATGEAQAVEQEDQGGVSLTLPARQTRILVTSIAEK